MGAIENPACKHRRSSEAYERSYGNSVGVTLISNSRLQEQQLALQDFEAWAHVCTTRPHELAHSGMLAIAMALQT